jgi:hypothetical protein
VQPQQADGIADGVRLEVEALRHGSGFERERLGLAEIALEHREAARRLGHGVNPLLLVGRPADEFGAQHVALRIGP